MTFMLLPPEVNSGMIYAGPGPGSLMSAATAWDGLAGDLTSTATSVQSTISELTGSAWQGPSSMMLTGAAYPYAAWLHTTAAQAAQVGAHAKTAAGLFETTYASTVPPPVIEANRALLMSLVSTNFFGQNTPAIMATEAQYMAMWAQDGATLDHYMAASEANTAALQAQQPTPAPPVSNGTGLDQLGNLGAPTQSAAQPALQPTSLFGHAGSLLSSNPLSSLTSLLGSGAGGSSALSSMQALYYPAMLASLPARILPTMIASLARMGSMGSLGSTGALASHGAGAAGNGALMTQIGNFVDGKLQGAMGTLAAHFDTTTQAVSARLSQAASLGSLKVPQAWSMAAEGMVRAAPVLPNSVNAPVMSPPVQTMSSGMPGGPFGNAMIGALAGRGIGGIAAKAPKVIPRSPAGG